MDKSLLAEALVLAGARLDGLGLVPGEDGNLSARLKPDRLLITASGTRKRSLTAEDMVEVDLDRGVIGSGTPSTELGLHLTIYRNRPEVNAVVHAHPPVAVGFATAGEGLTEPLLPEATVRLGPVPLIPYATPGTPELEAAILPAAKRVNAMLLANHGAVTMGESVDQALDRMEILEHLARITLVANLLGGGKPLSPVQIEALTALRPRSPGR